MKLDDMKRIADARTKGEWGIDPWRPGTFIRCFSGYTNYVSVEGKKYTIPHSTGLDDAEFIAMAANNWDKLMAVVEAAKQTALMLYPCSCGEQQLSDALKALEKV